jgi:hypothetical protein
MCVFEQRFRVLYQSFILICLGNQAMCESGSNCGGEAHLIGNHQPAVTPKKTPNDSLAESPAGSQAQKNVSRTLLPRLPYSIEYSPAKKSPPEPFGVTKLSEKDCA